MGMKESPCAGWVVDANSLTNLLPHLVRAEYDERVSSGDWEAAAKLLAEHWPKIFPPVAEVFVLGDEDTGDYWMERGGIYARFDEDSLYIRVPTVHLTNLINRGGRAPEHHSWTMFG